MDPEALRAMWERSPDLQAISAGDGAVVEVNPAALRFGLTVGASLVDRTIGRARSRMNRLIRRARSGFEAVGEVAIEVDGKPRTFLLGAVPLGDGRIAWTGRDVTVARERDAKRLATIGHDALTGLPDRIVWRDRLEQAIKRALRTETGIGMMFIDLDAFKQINDRFGHATGDRVLVGVAQRVRDVLRPADTLARVGGDEFIVLCEGMANVHDLERLGHRVAETVSQERIVVDGQIISVSCSVGVTYAQAGNIDLELFMATADNAMYGAKRRGPGQLLVTAYEQPSDRLLAGLRRALEAGTLPVAVEPVVDLERGDHVGYAVEVNLGDRPHAHDALQAMLGNPAEVHQLAGLLVQRGIEVAHEYPDGIVQMQVPEAVFADEAAIRELHDRITRSGIAPERMLFAVDAAGARAERTIADLKASLDFELPIVLTKFGLHSVDIAALSAMRPRVCELAVAIAPDSDGPGREHLDAACAVAHAVGAATQIPGIEPPPAGVPSGIDRFRKIPALGLR